MSAQTVFNKQAVAVIEMANADSGRIYISIHENVYDVTDFLNEHPGGEKVLTDYQIKSGKFKDATEVFEDVGHSMDARDLMKKYQIGILESKKEKPTQEIKDAKKSDGNSKWVQGGILLAVGVGTIAAFAMAGKK